jgi:carbon storage regulator
MLVIRRRPGECFLVGDDVEIEVLDSSPSHVKLGIRAPKSVIVMRKEIHITRKQNVEASHAGADLGALEQLLISLKLRKP